MTKKGHSTSRGGATRVPLIQEVLLAGIDDSWSPSQVKRAIQMLDGGAVKFPPGRRRVPPPLVSAVERAWLVSAMLETVAEHGWRDATFDEVIVRCSISRITFYAHFANKDELYLECLDRVVAHVHTRLEMALSGGTKSWRETLRRGLGEVLRFVNDEPDAARALIVEARCAFPEAVERHDALLDHLASCIEAKIRDERIAGHPPATAASGIVGGVASLLFTRITRGDTNELDALLPELVYFALVPYIGHDEAVAEMAQFPPS